MSRILLVQPDASGFLSGGYLYNARMAAEGAWDLRSLAFGDLDEALDHVNHDLVIADSIWLTQSSFAPFLRLATRGVRVAVIMHSFPSMIAAAEGGHGARSRPATLEVELLERVRLALVPGLHYAEVLRGSKTEVHVLEPGIDDAWRAPPRSRRDRCSLVSVGAVTPRKGFRDVLEALRGRAQNDWRWTVVGSLDAHPGYAKTFVELAREVEAVD